MPKIMINDLTSGLANNTIHLFNADTGGLFDPQAPNGSLAYHSLCNPFQSPGTLSLNSAASYRNVLSNSIGTAGKNKPIYMGPAAGDTGMMIISPGSGSSESVNYSIGYNDSSSDVLPDITITSKYQGTNAQTFVGGTLYKFGTGSIFPYMLLAPGVSSAWDIYRVEDTGQFTSINATGTLTGYSTGVSMPFNGEVRTPIFVGVNGLMYIMNSHYIHKIDGPGNTFTGEVLKSPGGYSFLAAIDYNMKMWIASNLDARSSGAGRPASQTGNQCVVWVWGYVSTTLGFENAIPVPGFLSITDLFILDGKPTVAGITVSGQAAFARYDGEKFVIINVLGYAFGDTFYDPSSATPDGLTLGMANCPIFPSTASSSRFLPYYNGIVWANDYGNIYWIGKVKPNNKTYSIFKIASLSKILSLAGESYQNTSKVAYGVIKDRIVYTYKLSTSAEMYIASFNPFATSNANSSAPSTIRFNDIMVPANSTIDNIKILLPSRVPTNLSTGAMGNIRVSIASDGKIYKTTTLDQRDAALRGYINITAGLQDASRISIQIDADKPNQNDAFRAPRIERIEMNYNLSNKHK